MQWPSTGERIPARRNMPGGPLSRAPWQSQTTQPGEHRSSADTCWNWTRLEGSAVLFTLGLGGRYIMMDVVNSSPMVYHPGFILLFHL